MYTEQLSQALRLGTPVHPASTGTGTADSGSVDMSKFRRAMFLVNVGSVGAAGTVDAKLQESSDDSSFTDLSGTGVSISQITTSNKIATLEVRAGQLTKRYVRCRVTIGGNAVLLCVNAIGGEAIQKPGSATDAAAVAQRQVVS
jgi:hypothetical protein